ncbi:Gag-Pol polyprotein [Plecturocebus cupreus]
MVVQATHETTHLGQESLEKLLGRYFYISHLSALTKTVAQRCIRCQQHKRGKVQLCPWHSAYGAGPFEDLQVDFTEMPKCGGHKYLLILVCTYSEWVETFPTRTGKAHEVTPMLLGDLIPRSGLLLCICSDNGPASVADLIQKMAMALGITWKRHAVY